MTTPRKVRSDAKLEQLSADQQTWLRYWLDDENYSYSTVVDLVRKQFGVSVGCTAVASYYQRHIVPLRYDEDTDAATAMANLPEGDFDVATIKLAKLLAWRALSRPNPQIDAATRLLELVRRAERQAIAERRLELEERRVAVREKEAAHRARHRPSAARAEKSAPASRPVPTSPSDPAVAHHEPPHPESPDETATPETPATATPAQKIPQNSPLFPGYLGLNRPPTDAEISPPSS